jgi:HEPN domain-containing protein
MSYKAWLSTAREYIEATKLELINCNHAPAYYNATHAADTGLKALLTNIGYSEKEIIRKFHHKELDMMEAIRESGRYPKTLLDSLDELLLPSPDGSTNNIPHTDFPAVGLVCDQGEAINTRYPREGIAPSEYISPNDARKKITLCKELINIIESYFNAPNT